MTGTTAPGTSRQPDARRAAAPVSFFVDEAIVTIVPSGVRSAPPKPHSDLAAGLTAVAPASTAASIRLRTVAGWATTNDSVKPRNPFVGASEGRNRTAPSRSKAAS